MYNFGMIDSVINNWGNINKNIGKYKNNKKIGLWDVLWFYIDNSGQENQENYNYNNKVNYNYMENIDGICIEIINKVKVE